MNFFKKTKTGLFTRYLLTVVGVTSLCWTALFATPTRQAYAAPVQLPPETNYSATDSGLTGDDRTGGPYDIGFNFTYYGNAYSQFQLTTNGLLCFGGGATSAYSETTLPNSSSPNNCIYAFWDDLYSYNISTQPILYRTIGSSPNRELIAQWTNYGFFSSTLPMGTFQVILYEGTNNIRLQYRQLLTAERSLGQNAAIGVENSDGSVGVQYSYHTASLTPEQSILWTWNGSNNYNYNSGAAYEGVFLYKDNPPPGVPNLLSPTNGSAGVSTSPTFTWEAATNTTTYSLRVSTNSNLSSPVISVDNLTGLSYTGSGLSVGPTYYWGVHAFNSYGDTWSSIWSFTTAAGNSAPTDITLSNNTLAAGQPINTAVGTLSTSDPDAGNTHAYSFVSGAGSGDNGSFNLSGNSLRTSVVLSAGSYGVRIRSTDQGGLYVDKAFTIIVTSSNQNPTDMSLSASIVAENQAANTSVGTFSTTDPDAGDTFTYTLVAGTGSEGNGSFNVSGINLRTSAIFDYETINSYSIRVRSTDGGGLWVERNFTINVTNVNEAPEISEGATATLTTDEDTAGSITLHATDVDSATLNWSISSQGSKGSASVSGSGFSQVVSYTPNTDQNGSDSFTVQVSDGSLTDTITVNVTINAVNDSPTWASFSVLFDEDVVSYTRDLWADVSDVDNSDAQMSFSIVGTPDPVLFSSITIDADAHTLVIIPNLNANGMSTITIRVCDPSLSCVNTTPSMTINAVNDAPTSISLSNSNVDEEQPSGTQIGILSTIDVETDQTYIYTLAAGCGGTENGYFSISGNELLTNGVWDFEADPHTLYVCVRSTDNGTPTLNTTRLFAVTMNDINDTPADILLSNTSVSEEQITGTIVGSLSTDDEDPLQTFAYTLVDSCGLAVNDNAYFEINNSDLVTSQVLDYETAPTTYSICIQTSDDGSPSAHLDKQFTISLLDINDSPTDILLSNNSIDENQPIGTTVGNLSTTDEDSAQTYTYTFNDENGVCDGSDNTGFVIDGGTIKTTSVLDYEIDDHTYSICVISTDNGTPTLNVQKQFTISLLDVNDIPVVKNPILDQTSEGGSPYLFAFSEAVFFDQDDDPLIYTATLQDGSPLPAWFTFTGNMRLFLGAPSVDDAGTLQIKISANDGRGGTATNTFYLSITIAGNQPPQLVNPISDITVKPELPFTYTVSDTTFIDPDSLLPLIYASKLADGNNLPDWLVFNPISRVFAGTPPAGTTVPLEIVVFAFDNQGGTANDTFFIYFTISEENLPPVLQIMLEDKNAREGELFSYVISPDTFFDVEGAAITYLATLSDGALLPSWLNFDVNTHTFSGTPALADIGSILVRVTGTDDSENSASDVFRIAISSADGFTINRVLSPGGNIEFGNLIHITVPAGVVGVNSHTYILIDTIEDTTQSINGFDKIGHLRNIKIINENGVEILVFPKPLTICFSLTDAQVRSFRYQGFTIAMTPDSTTPWTLLESTLNVSDKEACAHTTHLTFFDIFLKTVNETMPASGFAPDVVTVLRSPLETPQFEKFSALWVEIPSIQLAENIVGVYPSKSGWDISWLGSQVGWLNSTAFPTSAGNSVLTGHVVDANGESGSFFNLGKLNYGDQIIVHHDGVKYTYEVRKVENFVNPDNQRCF